MKVTEITTDKGTYRFNQLVCSNGDIFDAEGSYNYCMAIGPHSDAFRKVQASKLIVMGIKVSDKAVNNTEWYKNRHNFRDVETEDER